MKTIKTYKDMSSDFTGIVEHNSGDKAWWKNGKRHRENGPAIEFSSGAKSWWINGKCHRDDGPAVEWINGYEEWWLNGINYYSKEEYFNALSPEQRLKFIYSDFF
jgi:hypothetical protein